MPRQMTTIVCHCLSKSTTQQEGQEGQQQCRCPAQRHALHQKNLPGHARGTRGAAYERFELYAHICQTMC